MSQEPVILCIGSVLWDIIGRSGTDMGLGFDVPGKISRLPGGVAMNIAMTLRRFGLAPQVLTHIGRDPEGDELIAACAALGVGTTHAHRSDHLPTDRYLAIEGTNGLIAAVADAFSLEASGELILAPLANGPLGSADQPFKGVVAIDGNLTRDLLATIAASPLFATADIRIAPASPGKASRIGALLGHPSVTFYVNCLEAGLICGRNFTSAPDAAAALRDLGAARALVTNGAGTAAMTTEDGVISATPPQVTVTRVTGAGDTFMAAHIAAELGGATPQAALARALDAAATYVSGVNVP